MSKPKNGEMHYVNTVNALPENHFNWTRKHDVWIGKRIDLGNDHLGEPKGMATIVDFEVSLDVHDTFRVGIKPDNEKTAEHAEDGKLYLFKRVFEAKEER